MVALLEEARAVGELAKTGWKPKRTIVYCAWDAEEPGLIGSTEWAETHADELRRKAVLYLNSDSNGRGFLGVGGSHTLEKFVKGGSDVNDRARRFRLGAESGRDSRRQRRRAARGARGKTALSALGSGRLTRSCKTSASPRQMVDGEDGGGYYNSIYDSEHTRASATRLD